MDELDNNKALNKDGRTDVIELVSGQCVVIQCNPDSGRTFIRSMRGERVSSEYPISYQGERLALEGSVAVKQVGFCTLDEGLYERLKVREYLSFWAELHEVQASLAELLSIIGLAGKAHERISKLSYSEKRLLSFVRSVVHDPAIIVWEDPEQNLDLESCIIVRRLIDELIRRDKAILVTCATLEQAHSISNTIFRLTGSGLVPVSVPEQTETIETNADVDDGEPETFNSSELSDQALRLAKLMVKTEDKYVFIDPREIHYIESNEGITCVHTKEGSFPCAWTLAELEDKLRPFRFYRCHRSYIVNLDRLTELIVWSRNSYSLVLSDDRKSRIPLSKGKFEELKTIVGL
ncbi:LytTR family transcriptional regulator DNA-binding domain-containing protein [Paenibacillus sp. YIM B09110]|uniref:LytTR family transcriptional regulator DNA-binding domain-containing protein n=1 Tax=Paenibacillus sp. YIM B09110 TaxID=3126102 RepID=UPI00301BC660